MRSNDQACSSPNPYTRLLRNSTGQGDASTTPRSQRFGHNYGSINNREHYAIQQASSINDSHVNASMHTPMHRSNQFVTNGTYTHNRAMINNNVNHKVLIREKFDSLSKDNKEKLFEYYESSTLGSNLIEYFGFDSNEYSHLKEFISFEIELRNNKNELYFHNYQNNHNIGNNNYNYHCNSNNNNNNYNNYHNYNSNYQRNSNSMNVMNDVNNLNSINTTNNTDNINDINNINDTIPTMPPLTAAATHVSFVVSNANSAPPPPPPPPPSASNTTTSNLNTNTNSNANAMSIVSSDASNASNVSNVSNVSNEIVANNSNNVSHSSSNNSNDFELKVEPINIDINNDDLNNHESQEQTLQPTQSGINVESLESNTNNIIAITNSSDNAEIGEISDSDTNSNDINGINTINSVNENSTNDSSDRAVTNTKNSSKTFVMPALRVHQKNGTTNNSSPNATNVTNSTNAEGRSSTRLKEKRRRQGSVFYGQDMYDSESDNEWNNNNNNSININVSQSSNNNIDNTNNNNKNKKQVYKRLRCKCPVVGCSVKYQDRSSLLKHFETNHGQCDEIPYACNLCKFVTDKERNLYSHWRTVHGCERPFMCSFGGCHRKFARKCDLTSHARAHFGGCQQQLQQSSRAPRVPRVQRAPVQTNEINEMNTAAQSQTHRNKQKNKRKRKKFICDECSKELSSHRGLVNHRFTQHRLFPSSMQE